MTHNKSIRGTISEVKSLLLLLKKSKQIQVRSSTEKEHIQAVAYSWYENHRKVLIHYIPQEHLKIIDQHFQKVLCLSEQQPSRKKVNKLLKEIYSRLVSVQAQTVIEPSVKHAQQIPDFSRLIPDAKMQEILRNRWIEIEKCLSVSAGLSAIVMMGGILEGLLMAKVNADSNKNKLFTCKAIPIDSKTKTKIPLNKWTLKVYIDVAHEMGWIGKGAKDVGAVLRDYRNLIHPQKELTQKIQVTKRDAQLFWKITSAITEELL